MTGEQQSSLDKPLSIEELRTALFQSSPGKSPGNDGLPYEFYKTFWELIGADLCDVFDYWFSNGCLSVSQRRAVVTLIPKRSDLEEIGNWRPISLLNCDYKIASKAIANRVGTVLPSIISNRQTCSIKNRTINQHTILLRDTIAYARHRKFPLYILSFDQKKAFDLVDWGFLFLVLEHFKFPPKLIAMIASLYSDIQSAILVNGRLTTYFLLTRGVRQGCPLSLLLYVLMIEILNNYLHYHLFFCGFTFREVNLTLTNLHFADDTTAILSDITSYNHLLSLLDNFCASSGAILNHNKTRGIYLNHPSFIPLPNITWNHEDTKILGIYFSPDLNKSMLKNWSIALSKIRARTRSLALRKLSLKGKVNIINSLVLAKAWHIGFVFLPPRPVINQINAVLFAYLTPNKKNHEKIKRSLFYLPVRKGGLGLLPLETQCQSLQTACLKECIPQQPSAWAQVMFMFMLSLLTKFQPWNHLSPIKYRFLPPSHYIQLLSFVRPLFTKFDFKNGLSVRNIRLNSLEAEPILSPSSSSRIAHSKYLTQSLDWKNVASHSYLSLGSLIPCNTFFQLMHNAFPSRTNITKWFRKGPSYDVTCMLCLSEPESSSHIFLCSRWSSVWQSILSSIVSRNCFSSRAKLEKLIFLDVKFKCRLVFMVIFNILHQIYLARNAIVYDKKNVSPEDVRLLALRNIKIAIRQAVRHDLISVEKHSDVINILHDGSVTFNF